LQVRQGSFIWHHRKEEENVRKHGVDFSQASNIFKDPNLLIVEDEHHSGIENRYFAIGRLDQNILTVRFTYRHNAIRIIGAGFWRKGVRLYDKESKH